jgi:hypothetical protein
MTLTGKLCPVLYICFPSGELIYSTTLLLTCQRCFLALRKWIRLGLYFFMAWLS